MKFKVKLLVSLTLILIVLASNLLVRPAEAQQTTSIEETVANVSRAVEEIRELKFQRQLPVELKSRAEVAETLNFSAWEGWELAQQEYEALYLLSEDEDIRQIYQSFYGSALLGYYDAESDEIVIVSDAGGTIDKAT